MPDHFLAMDPGTVIEEIDGVKTSEPVILLCEQISKMETIYAKQKYRNRKTNFVTSVGPSPFSVFFSILALVRSMERSWGGHRLDHRTTGPPGHRAT